LAYLRDLTYGWLIKEVVIARRLARKGALWFALVAFTRKPRRGASPLAEVATKLKIGLN
jgi:hypothetical protein